MKTTFIAICLVLAAAGVAATEPNFPVFPDTFVADAEIKFISQNATFNMLEAYDHPQERLSILFRDGNGFDVTIFDFNGRVQYNIKDSNNDGHLTSADSCIRKRIAEDDTFPQDARHQLVTPSEALGLDGVRTYLGVSRQRGIDCDGWSIPLSRVRYGVRMQGVQQIYFERSYWQSYNDKLQPTRKPVRVTEQFDVYNATTNALIKAGEQIQMDFVGFRVENPPDEYFHPGEAVCTGPLSTQERSLPELPLQFTTTVEAIIIEKNYSFVLEEVYDYSNNRAAFTVHHNGSRVSVIDFVGAGQRFFLAGSSCELADKEMPARFRQLLISDNHLRATESFLQFGSQFNETYQGRARVRGIPCDKWTRHMNFNVHRDARHRGPAGPPGDVVFDLQLDWYFSTSDFTIAGGHEDRIPVMAELRGTMQEGTDAAKSIHHKYNYVNFWQGNPMQTEGYFGEYTWFVPTTCNTTAYCNDNKEEEVCTSGIAAVYDTALLPEDCKLVERGFGFVLLGAVLTVVIGAAIYYYRNRRSFKRMTDSDASTELAGSEL